MKRANLIGNRYGRLTVKAFGGMSKSQKTLWVCQCECGNEVIVAIDNLKSGHTKSCGCYNNERISALNRKHQDCNSPLYAVLRTMKARCYRTTSEKYRYYGARGITICDEWLRDYAEFKEWAIRNGYSKGLSIDRIDNNKGYSPENCRWTTADVQNKNRRPNRSVPKITISMEE